MEQCVGNPWEPLLFYHPPVSPIPILYLWMDGKEEDGVSTAHKTYQINNFPSTWRATLKREMQYVFQLISIILWLWISIDIYSLVGGTETQTNSDTNGNASLFLSSQALGQVLLFLCLPAPLIRGLDSQYLTFPKHESGKQLAPLPLHWSLLVPIVIFLPS